MSKLFLLRYDTESRDAPAMAGFLECAVSVHRRHQIPASFFCTGGAIEAREADFRDFGEEVRDDPLFDIQDHSYSHIGLGYEAGKPVGVLRDDYARSMDAHERVFGVRPFGVSICGTGGKDGKRLPGFDATDKSREEFEMIVGLGVRMLNACLCGVRESDSFIDYGSMGHPEVMGFPSSYSDTSWMHRRENGDPMEYILGEIDRRADACRHFPLMLHDWVAWCHAPGPRLEHVVEIVDRARARRYEPATHASCLRQSQLWG